MFSMLTYLPTPALDRDSWILDQISLPGFQRKGLLSSFNKLYVHRTLMHCTQLAVINKIWQGHDLIVAPSYLALVTSCTMYALIPKGILYII